MIHGNFKFKNAQMKFVMTAISIGMAFHLTNGADNGTTLYVTKSISEVTDTGIFRLPVGEKVTVIEDLGEKLKVENNGKIWTASASNFSAEAPIVQAVVSPPIAPGQPSPISPASTPAVAAVPAPQATPDYRAVNRAKIQAKVDTLKARIEAAEAELAAIDKKKPKLGVSTPSGVKFEKGSAGSYKISRDATGIKELRRELADLERDLLRLDPKP